MRERHQPTSNKESARKPPIGEIITEAGGDIEAIAPEIIERLGLLHQKTETVNDELRALRNARKFFRYHAEKHPERPFSPGEERAVTLGTLFTDIGKTGPKNAPPEVREIIADIFGVENEENPETSLEEFMGRNFPHDVAERIRRLDAIGIKPSMTMRQFWNLHSVWTLEIIAWDGVPPEAAAVAAAHHMLEGMDPYAVASGRRARPRKFIERMEFDRAAKLVILLDKYDAACRRGGKTHAEAIAYIRSALTKNKKYAGDQEFLDLQSDLEDFFKDNWEKF